MTSSPGWDLLHTLKAHTAPVGRLAWSRDGALLATPGGDAMLVVWDASTGSPVRVVRHPGPVECVAFSPDGKRVATGYDDDRGTVEPGLVDSFDEEFGFGPLPPEMDELLGDYEVSAEWEEDPDVPGVRLPIRVSDARTGELDAVFYSESVHSYPTGIDWSPDGRWLVTASRDGLGVWQVRTGTLVHLRRDDGALTAAKFSPEGETVASVGAEGWMVWDHPSGDPVDFGEREQANALAWSTNGELAVGTGDGTVEVVRPNGDGAIRYLEGHTRAITAVSFSGDGRLLASKSLDGTVRIWSTDSWEALSVLREPARGQTPLAGMAFAPRGDVLATLGPGGRVVRVWELDPPTIAARRDVAPTTHYANSKVVLVGDTGVGKTGLGLVLAGEAFKPTSLPTDGMCGASTWRSKEERSPRGGKPTYGISPDNLVTVSCTSSTLGTSQPPSSCSMRAAKPTRSPEFAIGPGRYASQSAPATRNSPSC